MRQRVQSSPTLRSVHGGTWFGRLFGWFRGDDKLFAVRIGDAELRRIGHLSRGQAETKYTRDEFRAIKRPLLTKIKSERGDPSPRIILVTSARNGEGKTFVALNLALSLAIEPGLNVTLVDADLGHGDLSQQFGLGRTPGLLDCLDDASALDSVVLDTNVANLNFVPLGNARVHGAELMSSEGMSQFLNALLTASPNEIVVLDTGAILANTVPVVLAEQSGQVLFVIASNESRRPDVEDALVLLDRAVGPLEEAAIGLVLNKIDPSRSRARYSSD